MLYANLKNEAELIKGTGKGATSCLVCFAIGMLLLDAPLFIAPLEYSYNCGTYGTIFRTACTGFGLPPFIEEQLVPILDAIWFYTTVCEHDFHTRHPNALPLHATCHPNTEHSPTPDHPS